MPFVFTEKVSAMRSLVEAGDPAAERLVRELLADPLHRLDAVAGFIRLDLARGDVRKALFHAGCLVRLAPGRLDFLTLNAAIALSAGRHRDVLVLADRAQRVTTPDATLLGIALQAARAGGGQQHARDFATRLARLGALQDDSIAALDEAVLLTGDAPGWVSPTAEQGLVGSLRPALLARAHVTWRSSGRSAQKVPLHQVAALENAGSLVRFHLEQSALPQTGLLSIEGDGAELVGSPVKAPVRPVILGMVEDRLGETSGWAWAPGRPDAALDVRVTDAAGRWIDVVADGPSPAARSLIGARDSCGFGLDVERCALGCGPFLVMSSGAPLSGSPVPARHRGADASLLASHRRSAPVARRRPGESALFEALARTPISAESGGRRISKRQDDGPPPRRAVLVPLYDGRDESLACLASVLRSVPAGTRVLVVDDASPDPALSDALTEMARSGAIMLIRNEVNLGYPRSVNRGLERLEGCDVVLLNGDALVANDWLDRMTAACHREVDIGTVTALAPSGSIASYGVNPDDRTHGDVAAIDRAARIANPGHVVDVPTGVGHCLYLRADCVSEVGLLDDQSFGRGYGEENDFCLRARALGWRSVVAADVFVGHLGERSFGSQRRILSRRNGPILERLYPGYDALVARHVACDPLAPARRQIDVHRLRSGAAPVLLITMGWKGGVATHVARRVEQFAQAGRRVLVLTPMPRSVGDQRDRCRLVVDDQPELRDLIFGSDDFDDLVALLRALQVCDVEFHHTLHHDPRVLDLPGLLDLPYGIVVHDYSWICPRIALIGGSGRYCGEPDDEACESCVRSFGSVSQEAIGVKDLRSRSRGVFEKARSVVVPCEDVATRMRRYVADSNVTTVAWDDARPRPRRFPTGSRLIVAVPGSIGLHKGFAVLKACAEDAAANDLPLDFVVIGHTQDDHALLATGRVFITGEYGPDEIEDLLIGCGAGVALLPSVCPETWSYTLSDVWRSGLEVLAFDLGAIAERIRAHGGGRLLPLGAGARTVNDALLAWRSPPVLRA